MLALDGTPLQVKINFTDLNGNFAEIVGDSPAIRAIEEIFKRCGVTYDEQSDSWDEGYYCESSPGAASLDS